MAPPPPPPPPIYMVPEYLQQYKADPVSDLHEPCCACWRKFGEKDDPLDANEIPCRPLRLQPCRHIVGHQCLREMKKRAISNCPMCRTPLITVPLPSIRTAKRVADITMLRLAIDLTVRYIREYTDAGPYNALLHKLYSGDIEFIEAPKLWWIHMCAWFAIITRVGFVCLRTELVTHVANALVIWMVKDTSLWTPLYRFFVSWDFCTTYEEVITSGVGYTKAAVKGCVFVGGLSMICLAYCIGSLIWAGVDLRRAGFVTARRNRVEEMRREVVLVRACHMFSKPDNWSAHVRYMLPGTVPDA
ncbi:hypothetical protein HBI47_093690 [Parastagonospora nodorum]|nr:hypothetical protein HBI47_093690 [Parastagonospora nodorum]